MSTPVEDVAPMMERLFHWLPKSTDILIKVCQTIMTLSYSLTSPRSKTKLLSLRFSEARSEGGFEDFELEMAEVLNFEKGK